MAQKNILLQLKSFIGMPFAIQREIGVYYMKRLIRQKPTDHQIIWTSFLYFASERVASIIHRKDLYLVEFEFEGALWKTSIRAGDSSDIFAFFQVFITEGYKPLLNLFKGKSPEPLIIIDAGANVGYFSLLMQGCLHPEVLVALEPEKSNYYQLKINLGDHSNFQPIQSALWTHKKILSIESRKGKEWAAKITEQDSGEVCQAVSLTDIMLENNIRKIDILKLDVEGTEDALFRNADFLNAITNVKIIGIEIHDSMADRKMILKALTERNFEFFSKDELTVAWNTRLWN